jgi:hypothetical protein
MDYDVPVSNSAGVESCVFHAVGTHARSCTASVVMQIKFDAALTMQHAVCGKLSL